MEQAAADGVFKRDDAPAADLAVISPELWLAAASTQATDTTGPQFGSGEVEKRTLCRWGGAHLAEGSPDSDSKAVVGADSASVGLRHPAILLFVSPPSTLVFTLMSAGPSLSQFRSRAFAAARSTGSGASVSQSSSSSSSVGMKNRLCQKKNKIKYNSKRENQEQKHSHRVINHKENEMCSVLTGSS